MAEAAPDSKVKMPDFQVLGVKVLGWESKEDSFKFLTDFSAAINYANAQAKYDLACQMYEQGITNLDSVQYEAVKFTQGLSEVVGLYLDSRIASQNEKLKPEEAKQLKKELQAPMAAFKEYAGSVTLGPTLGRHTAAVRSPGA
jgi:hypothetical protein